MHDIQQSKVVIDSVDLSEVIERLVHIDKWKKNDAIEACKQYRHFLYLKKKYGDKYELPPSKDIDEAWHAHILHTEDYVNFCNEAFGGYLHHHPHTKKNALSIDQLAELFEKQTQHLYKQEFGDYIYAVRTNWKIRILGILNRIKTYRKHCVAQQKKNAD